MSVNSLLSPSPSVTVRVRKWNHSCCCSRCCCFFSIWCESWCNTPALQCVLTGAGLKQFSVSELLSSCLNRFLVWNHKIINFELKEKRNKKKFIDSSSQMYLQIRQAPIITLSCLSGTFTSQTIWIQTALCIISLHCCSTLVSGICGFVLATAW